MANFPNDGVGYDAHAELMAKRAGNRRATTLMLPSYWSAEDIVVNAAMNNNAADLRSIQSQALSGPGVLQGVYNRYREPTAREVAEADDCSLCSAAFGTCTC